MLDLICNTEQAVDELIDMAGKAAVEAMLLLSARQVAGPKQPGKATGDIGWHGRQAGVVSLSERKLRIEKPRLRKKGKGSGKEVAIPAYDAMVANSRLGSRILEILMKGVSTRKYKDILPQMADTVGVSESEISREFIDASANELEHKANRTSIYRGNNKKRGGLLARHVLRNLTIKNVLHYSSRPEKSIPCSHAA